MLALQFGYADPEELRAKIGQAQFNLWREFHSIRPFGNEWEDLRFGYQTAQLRSAFVGIPDGMRFDKFVEICMTPISGRENKWRGRMTPQEQIDIFESMKPK